MGAKWLNECSTKKERETIEFEHGVRYSELSRLPYFDPVRMHLIDPMHNLMLGKFFHQTFALLPPNFREVQFSKILCKGGGVKISFT